MILDELADEERWDEAFARSRDQLAKLTAQARDEIRAGRVRKMGVDEREFTDFGYYIACFRRLPETVQSQARKSYKLWRVSPSHYN